MSEPRALEAEAAQPRFPGWCCSYCADPLRPVGGRVPAGSMITPLPPPSGRPATADLNVIARESRSASRTAARVSS